MKKTLFLLLLLAGMSQAQTPVASASNPHFQLFNGSVPCSGCLLDTFSAGTTTPLVTYSESTGTNVNSNPVIADSNGFVTVYYTSANYKLRLRTSGGATLWTQDGVSWNTPLSTFSGISDAGTFTQTQPTAATGGANQSSFTDCMNGNYWNGSASATDQWCFQNVLGTGSNPTSTFTLTHSGSSGNSTFSIPSTAAFSLGGTLGITGVTTATGGLNVGKVIRDCRTDGVVCNATWNGTTLTGTDDSAAINACLTNAYAAGQGAVQLPAGQCRVNTTINDTNKPNLDVYGSNSNEDFSTAITGQNYGINQTQLLGNTGATPVWDATGTGRARLRNFGVRVANGFPSPSAIGFMFGRDNAVSGSGWTTGTGTFCFTEENKLENIWFYADTRPAATAVGTVAVYNVGAEQMQILGGGFIADNPLFITATNDLSLASPYQTLWTGCPSSMSEMKIGHGVNLQAWTRPAIDLRGVIDFESEADTEILNGLIGTNHSPAITFNAGVTTSTNIHLKGQDEGFDQPLSTNTNVNMLYAQLTAVAPTATGLITMNPGNVISCCLIAIPQINGTIQPVFTAAGAGAAVNSMIIDMGKNSGSGSAGNITLTGSTIYAPGLADGVVNTFNANSSYTVYDSTGMSTVGNYKFSNSLGVGAAALASIGVLVNNSALTGTTQTGVQSAPACSSAATVACEGIRSRFDTAASAFTVTTGAAVHVVEGVKGAGSTITTENGLLIDTLSNGTTNFAIQTGANPSKFGGSINFTNVLLSPTAPTIAGAGCGGSAASIATNNGTAAFSVNVGTAPTTACTITLPTATNAWNCYATDITTNSTSVFLQKQTATGATSVTITNFNDVAVAANFTANDILQVSCFAR